MASVMYKYNKTMQVTCAFLRKQKTDKKNKNNRQMKKKKQMKKKDILKNTTVLSF